MNKEKSPFIPGVHLDGADRTVRISVGDMRVFSEKTGFFRSTFLSLGTWAATILTKQALVKERPS